LEKLIAVFGKWAACVSVTDLAIIDLDQLKVDETRGPDFSRLAEIRWRAPPERFFGLFKLDAWHYEQSKRLVG
jgi:hypothetical protein